MSLNIVVEKTARRLVAKGSDGNICIRGVKTHLFVTLLFVVGAMPMAAQSVADLVARYEDLQKRARSEKNFEKARPLWDELYATDQKVCGTPLPELHDAWATEVDHRKKTQLADAVARAAIMQINTIEESYKEKQQELLDLIVEVATDGQFQQKQIKIDKEPQQVAIQPIHTIESDAEHDWVIRRPTADRIEVWLPRHGWLFDTKGALVNEARPPRRDGDGRAWYGAFLPDSRWVTTDLFADDKVLSFFSRDGKWLKELHGDRLVPQQKNNPSWSPPTIGWCRSVRTGDAFVASVGQDGGRGVALVTWNGKHRVLREWNEPWKLCFPRDLEPKGLYVSLYVPSDDAKIRMTREEAGHGPFVGYPVYEAGAVSARIPNGDTFGFWPGSHNVFIVTEDNSTSTYNASAPARRRSSIRRTWFYNDDGSFAGWIDAARIADTAALDGMIFVDRKQRLTSVGKDCAVRDVLQFIWPSGEIAQPERIFPDVRLGLFVRNEHLELAHW